MYNLLPAQLMTITSDPDLITTHCISEMITKSF